MTDLFTPPLSTETVNGMTVTVYPQLIIIERNGNRYRYVGWSKKDAIRLFRQQFPIRKHKK